MVSRRAGTFVYKAGTTFTQIAQNQLDDKSEFCGTPAVSGGALYLRSNSALYQIRK